MENRRSAFSLVELAVVLVILGLLVGGILAGRSLVHASEIRSVSSEYQQYVGAINTFRDKYFALPGDFNNAQSIWGAAVTCPGLAATATTGVCNGDGNNTLSPTATNSHEPSGAWEHLAMAGLIAGTYTGNTAHASDPTSNASLLGINVPASKLNGAGWTMYYLSKISYTNTNYFDDTYGVFFFFGAPTANTVTNTKILIPEDAWNIDTKLDDGLPGYGRVMTREADAANGCTDLASSIVASTKNSVYLLTTTDIACTLVMKTGYY